MSANTLRDTLLLRTAALDTLAKLQRSHPLKAPCLHLSQKGTSIVKKQKRSGLKASQGSCPLLTILAIFVEIWEREAAPAIYCLM
jgi:hypothetical protein